jgi:hypothetical protein
MEFCRILCYNAQNAKKQKNRTKALIAHTRVISAFIVIGLYEKG